ncbi:peptidase C39 family protein [Pseudomonas aeruginosa]|nr:peptidase C39 family protein [Pseudomonas aeruginosa]
MDVTRAYASLTVAEGDGGVLGYALVLFHEGTSLARLYSIAIDPRARGIGLGQSCWKPPSRPRGTTTAPTCAWKCAWTTVAPSPSTSATATVPSPPCATTTRTTAEALRFEKRIRNLGHDQRRHVPFYRQTTVDFTCGPACLLMATGALQLERQLDPPRGTAPVARGDHHLHDRRARRLQ